MVISLSKLEKYDGIPCFVVVVRRGLDNLIYMINTTFIDKVSHSSQSLRIDNIRGSVLGSNIRKQLPEIDRVNSPEFLTNYFRIIRDSHGLRTLRGSWKEPIIYVR